VVGNKLDGGAFVGHTNNEFGAVIEFPVGGGTLNGISGTAANDLWAAGLDGGVWHSTGGTWAFVDLGVAWAHTDWEAVWAGGGAVWLAGNGAVLNALDGGLALSTGLSYAVTGAGSSLYAAGHQTQQVLPQHTVFDLNTNWAWFGASAGDPDDLWFVGQLGDDGGMQRVVRAPDAGWQVFPPVACYGLPQLLTVTVLPGGERWMAGGDAVVLHGVGDTFTMVNLSPGNEWLWSSFTDGTHVWFTGTGGLVLRTP
jgi:hypothetical protein